MNSVANYHDFCFIFCCHQGYFLLFFHNDVNETKMTRFIKRNEKKVGKYVTKKHHFCAICISRN